MMSLYEVPEAFFPFSPSSFYIFSRGVFLLAGEYLALTGAKLNGAEMMACGLATHYSVSEVSSI